MIRGFIEAMLGEAGRSVLRFYEAHALVLGLLIVSYGILMYLSWLTVVRIYRYLVTAAAATLETASEATPPARSGGSKRSRQKNGSPESAELPWQEAVDSVRFPLLSQRAGLLPVRRTVAAARLMIDERELWKHAHEVAGGVDVRRISPEYRLAPRKQVGTHGKN